MSWSQLRRESSRRIKTFICIRIVCSLYGHEWQFDFSGVAMWAEKLTLVAANTEIFCMEIYLNSFWQIILEWVSSSSAHTIDTATMTWLFMVNDFLPIARFSSPSSGPWASSMIRFNIPFNWWAQEAIETWSMRLKRRRKPARSLREWFYRYERRWTTASAFHFTSCTQTEPLCIWTCWCWREWVLRWNGSDDFNQSDGWYFCDIASDVRLFFLQTQKLKKNKF